jgi:hypothetical protein
MSTVYTITRTPDLLPGTSGRRQLAVEAREWAHMANAIGRVIEFA